MNKFTKSNETYITNVNKPKVKRHLNKKVAAFIITSIAITNLVITSMTIASLLDNKQVVHVIEEKPLPYDITKTYGYNHMQSTIVNSNVTTTITSTTTAEVTITTATETEAVIETEEEIVSETEELVTEEETTAEAITSEEETESDEDDDKSGMTCIGNLKITGYVATGELTASGEPTYVGGVAMNRSYGLSFGTKIYIEGLGYYTINDTGCATGVVDIFCNSTDDCYELTSYANVYVVND